MSHILFGQVAKSVPFDNASNGFAAQDVQAAIEEIDAGAFQPSETTATSTQSTSSSTFAVINSMTATPASGDYLVMFSASTLATSDSDGEIAIFNNGTQITHSTRRIYCEAAGLLGAVAAASMGSHTMAIATVNGSQDIDVRYRATTGTITITNRNLTIVRIR